MTHVSSSNHPVSNYMHVVLHNYHDGEYPFDAMTSYGHGSVRYVWTYEMQQLAELAFPNDPADWGQTSPAAMKLFEQWLTNELPATPHGVDYGETVFVLSGTPEAVWDRFTRYVTKLEEDVSSGGPGADDGTYDYFPGAVEVCAQLVLAFKEADSAYFDSALPRYDHLISIARNTHYKGNEEATDLLPYYKEVPA